MNEPNTQTASSCSLCATACARCGLDSFDHPIYGICGEYMRRGPDYPCGHALDTDASPVPEGKAPREGVTYGCGAIDCADCYEDA